jgi:hypothetical protein
MPRGGHFAAMEEGASLAADVFGFVGKAMAYSTGERASAAGDVPVALGWSRCHVMRPTRSGVT